MRFPAALAAVKIPITKPFRFINQRLATDAAKTRAIAPVPPPTMSPQRTAKCQGCEMYWVHHAPLPTIVSAHITTLRIPKRSMSAAAKGAVSP